MMLTSFLLHFRSRARRSVAGNQRLGLIDLLIRFRSAPTAALGVIVP
jgi:hypothetical protein